MPDPVLVSFHVTDDEGRNTTTPIFLPAATSYANAQAYGTAFSKLIDDCQGAKTDAISITFGGTVHAGVKANPVANSPLFAAGNIAFNLAGVSKGWTFVIPGVNLAMLTGKKGYNTDGVPEQALIAALVTGIDIGGGVFVQPVNPFSIDITGFRSSSRSDRKF